MCFGWVVQENNCSSVRSILAFAVRKFNLEFVIIPFPFLYLQIIIYNFDSFVIVLRRCSRYIIQYFFFPLRFIKPVLFSSAKILCVFLRSLKSKQISEWHCERMQCKYSYWYNGVLKIIMHKFILYTLLFVIIFLEYKYLYQICMNVCNQKNYSWLFCAINIIFVFITEYHIS